MKGKRKQTESLELLGPVGVDPAELIERDDATVPEHKWAPLLVDIVRVIESRNLRKGMPAKKAFTEARDNVIAMADFLGGKLTYFPQGARLKQAMRDAEIWRAFNGHNVPQLAERFGLTEVYVYRVLKEQRALHLRDLQGRLFADNNEGNGV